jgi:site-specific recombinase XerD
VSDNALLSDTTLGVGMSTEFREEGTGLSMSSDLAPAAELGELAPALASAAAYRLNARSENTRRAYRQQWAAFESWCGQQRACALPALPATVAAYLAASADAGFSPATLDLALAAIAKAHHLAKHPNPRKSAEVAETRAGIRRRLSVAPTQKQALPVDALRAMMGASRTGVIGWRDRALLLIGFAGGFRREELVSLQWEDVTFTTHGVELLSRRGKTDQEGVGRRIGIPFGSVPATCPVQALQSWKTAGAQSDGPVFRAVSRHGRIGARLSDRDVARVVKLAAESVGFEPAAFAGHSLRSGLVTAAASVGKSNRAIRRQTGHHSDAQVDRYVRVVDLFHDNAASGIGL